MALSFNLPLLRIALYGALAFFSFILFALTCARIQYTTHLNKKDPLNGGRPFYDPIVAEVLFTTLMAMPWSAFMIYSIHKRYENRFISTFLAEIIGLSSLWLFWLVGTSIATSEWGNLSFCQNQSPCQVLSALVAFAWLGWITMTALLVICLLFTIANNAFGEPLHGRWDPRQSRYTVDMTSRA